ncbi:MAG: ABC transporter ATP-binding protein [Hyphomonadaceae bacterium]|jgi:spermidine/putrescine ABC transporter ATP-binding subunit|uniref:ABC transporter ATP-binding protein n=1 Tax=Aquidulcibacter sp. TaxID=2052990 RepID=UPI0022C78A60|nr:ABC transporter ATP-binding protein [Aquidulcibacter sp.]MCE2890600.1 ABC transporter ATP-binding protein [Hyphomonadaceae bacterium]MCZ8210306.1 ABC transporter ATP-binding protein [Aquidulcibacter sp.]
MSDRDTIIRVEEVSKRYGKVTAVDRVTLEIPRGEFFALLGPSGCGKTTLLRMLAGFEMPSEGKIFIDGVDMSTIPPNKRPVNMVFQSYAVFPHMTVFENVAYGLKFDNVAKADQYGRVMAALADVKLDHLAERKPDQMSGGQRQRVALARALVKKPKVLLLDEPLSALDAKLREAMRFELAELQDKVGITFVMVTHDQDEALAMAGRCAVMDRGKLMQTATPSNLYEFPANKFVADFIGSVNLFEGTLEVDEPDHAIVQSEELGGRIFFDHGVSGAGGEKMWVGIRPEKIELLKREEGATPPTPEDAPSGCNVTAGTVRQISYLGSESIYEIDLVNGRRMQVSRPNLSRWDQEDFTWDDEVWLRWHGDSPVLLQS